MNIPCDFVLPFKYCLVSGGTLVVRALSSAIFILALVLRLEVIAEVDLLGWLCLFISLSDDALVSVGFFFGRIFSLNRSL